jgi:hypothetical protein
MSIVRLPLNAHTLYHVLSCCKSDAKAAKFLSKEISIILCAYKFGMIGKAFALDKLHIIRYQLKGF